MVINEAVMTCCGKPKNQCACQTHNVFCSTGEGGGVDPSCSIGGGRSIKSAGRHPRVVEAVSSFSKAASKLVLSQLQAVEVYKDAKSLNRALREKYPNAVKEIVAGGKGIHREAVFVPGDGSLYLTESASPGVVAHELGHVLDGVFGNFSQDPSFQRAWKSEAKSLSRYAETHPAEGLAELFRLRHEQGAKAVERLAPKMTKALKSYWR